MKNLNLNVMGVTELNQQEMRDTQGGCCLITLLRLLKKGCNTGNKGGEPEIY